MLSPALLERAAEQQSVPGTEQSRAELPVSPEHCDGSGASCTAESKALHSEHGAQHCPYCTVRALPALHSKHGAWHCPHCTKQLRSILRGGSCGGPHELELWVLCQTGVGGRRAAMENRAVKTDPGQLSHESGWGLGRSLLQHLLKACPIQDAEELAHLTSSISKVRQPLLFGPLYHCPTTFLVCFFSLQLFGISHLSASGCYPVSWSRNWWGRNANTHAGMHAHARVHTHTQAHTCAHTE